MSGGELPADEIRAALHKAADLAADYLEQVESRPVLSDVEPGDVLRRLPEEPPLEAETMDAVLADYEEILLPALTHWNHPGFMAYFGITGSSPGIVADLLAASVNVNAMLWRTSPAATELEERVCDWLRRMVGLPADFQGHINDTASIATFLALAVARDRVDPDIRRLGQAGRPDLARLTIYASDQAHSSVDKAAIALGLGLDNVRRVASDGAYRMRLEALSEAVAGDRARGFTPVAVVATAGTTSTTSVDPMPSIAALCSVESLWLHVDAAYAGSAAICPEMRGAFSGWESADSIVLNPHKWMFTPFDCSVMLVREPERFRRAFSVVPDYLKTDEEGVTNLMDLGIQLGRRFRALKLWMVIRVFGVEGLRQRLREHCRLAQELAARIDRDPRFELVLEPPFSVVCFRLAGGGPDREAELNRRLLEAVNADGSTFLSSTVLGARTTLRVAIGNIKTETRHVEKVWELLDRHSETVLSRW